MSKTEHPAEDFNLKISGEGINVERKIDSQTLAAVMAAIIGAQRFDSQAGLVPTNAEATPPLQQPFMALREYLDKVEATRKQDQIVAIGHFISHYEAQPHFSRDEVRSHFSIAREPMPKNFARDFGLAVKAGMIAEVHQKHGFFYVTKTGISAVERHFAKINKRK